MNTLTVNRNWTSPYNQTTILRDNKDKVKAIITSILKQPKKGLKQITINNTVYLLDWSNT